MQVYWAGLDGDDDEPSMKKAPEISYIAVELRACVDSDLSDLE